MAMKLWGARAPGNAQEIRDANHMKNKKKVSHYVFYRYFCTELNTTTTDNLSQPETCTR